MIDPDRLAEAFGLSPGGSLEPLRHGDLPTWRWTIGTDRFVVKEIVPAAGELRREYVDRAMILERVASEAGIRTPEPVAPVRPDVGWCTKITGHGWYRAHAWVDHRPLSPDDEIAPWLGQTLATLHRLIPADDERDWHSLGIHDDATWRTWIDAAELGGRAWAGPARRRLPFIERLTDRLRSRYASAPDWVVTHGDLDRQNVLIAADGPVLIDWETVWPYSAAMQAGQVALRFGHDRPDRVRAILDCYRKAGGRIDTVGADLFIGSAGHRLASLGIRMRVVLGLQPPPRWLDPDAADRQIGDQLRRLPDLVADLDDRARAVTH
ncbi:aminoglycoside phosphotransferase family protein [Microlunatus speluncae]|uniref:phosphotransferase n=1 Tax=Microlunatus speluncae TaxID=2594267 RepID=UPI00126610CC|nr:aminoglycoside phosphotransferase family protein [Microlunatus speluncae]